MALSESRANCSIVKDAVVKAGSRTDYLNSKDEKPEGELAKNGSEAVKNSSFSEAKKQMVQDINNAKKEMNKALSNLTPEKLVEAMGGGPNKNTAAVNKALGVFKTVLCWDGNIDFSIQDLINALTINFNFLKTWSICGRQGIQNPLDNLLRSISRLENELNQLKNLDKRLLNNLKSAVNGMIKNLGLPKNLVDCMLNNSFLQTAEQYRGKSSLDALRQLAHFLNPDICKKSDEGVPAEVKAVKKIAMTPFVSGIANYPRETMIASLISLITSDKIDATLVVAALAESYVDAENPNTVKLLEMMAIIKAMQLSTGTTTTDKIGGINNLLINSTGSADSIIDAAITSVESDTKLNKNEMLSKVDSDSYFYVPELKPDIVLKNMADDFSESADPSADLEKIKKLLAIAMESFKPEENIGYLSQSSTIGTLLSYTEPNKKKDFEITNRNEMINQVSVDYLELDNTADAYFDAYIVKECDAILETA